MGEGKKEKELERKRRRGKHDIKIVTQTDFSLRSQADYKLKCQQWHSCSLSGFCRTVTSRVPEAMIRLEELVSVLGAVAGVSKGLLTIPEVSRESQPADQGGIWESHLTGMKDCTEDHVFSGAKKTKGQSDHLQEKG